MKNPCPRNCGRYRRGQPYTIDQCRPCWLHAHDWRYREVDVSRPRPVKSYIPCVHLGDEIGAAERERRGLTHLKVWRECSLGYGAKCRCDTTCGPVCRGYRADPHETEPQGEPMDPLPNAAGVMVSIGHYNMPGIIELQAKVIQANCGNIPIIVSDDHTETAGERGYENKLRLLDICEQYRLLYRDAGPDRIGHSGGDLGAFWHGLHHAAGNGIPYCVKLSQRFIIDRPQWAQKLATMLRDRGGHTMSQCHKGRGRFVFPIRSEFVLMDVRRWMQANIIGHLRPRVLNGAAETVVSRCLSMLGGNLTACPLFTPERTKHCAGVYWYESSGDNGYKQLADKYGVTLGDGYHAVGSHLSPAYRLG